MNTQHTPGPWKTRRFDDEAEGRHNFTVQAALCEVARMSQVDEHIAEANARRIVACVNACEGINPEAVPELLEALGLLLDGAEQAVKAGLIQPQVNGGIVLARAAIAKAQTL